MTEKFLNTSMVTGDNFSSALLTPLEISRVRNKRRFVGNSVGNSSCDPNYRRNGVKIRGTEPGAFFFSKSICISKFVKSKLTELRVVSAPLYRFGFEPSW